MVTNNKISSNESRVKFEDAVASLGGDRDIAGDFFDIAWGSGLQASRFYHTPKHYLDVSEDENNSFDPTNPFSALRYITGFHHDIVYHHVDQKLSQGDGFSSGVREIIEQLVTLDICPNKNVSVLFSSQKLLDPIAQSLVVAANILCSVTPDSAMPEQAVELNKFNGQNEYLSSLYAINAGMKMHIPPHYILSEIVMIAGTIPFKPSNRFMPYTEEDEGNQLEPLLRQIILDFPLLELCEEDIQQTMDYSVQVANADIKNFGFPFVSDTQDSFIQNSYNVLLENMSEQPNDANICHISPLTIETAMRNMSNFMQVVAKRNGQCVFHTRDGSLHPAESTAKDNINKLDEYLETAFHNINLLEMDYTLKNGEEAASWADLHRHIYEQFLVEKIPSRISLSPDELDKLMNTKHDGSAYSTFSILGQKKYRSNEESQSIMGIYLNYLKNEIEEPGNTAEEQRNRKIQA